MSNYAKKAVGYARVSVRDEDVMNQVRAIEEYAGSNNIELVRVFTDTAVTGASDPFNRESFVEMYRFCVENGVKTILIYDLTRLGRSLITSINTLKKLIDEGFEIIFIRHNIRADLNDPVGKVMIYTLLMVAELERDFMRMRQMEAWRQGKQKGRPRKITLEEVEAYIRRYPGLSISAIAKIINADRERKRMPKVSYYSIYRASKKLGYRRTLTKD